MADPRDWPEDWIGREAQAQDVVTPRMLEAWAVTLGDLRGPGDPGLHWTLAPDQLPADALGRDGHPAPGRVLPKTPLPRRMWAGGEIRWHAPFAAGDVVTRTSTIAGVEEKRGRSGPLCFVTVEHCYAVGGATRVEERQDIVYRDDPAPGAPEPAPPPAPDWEGAETVPVAPDATLLFRFSALTFNGHRIHYDAEYAREVEGYAGLVVHGPLQAVWMQNLAAKMLGRPASVFRYRARTPLIVGRPAKVEGVRDGEALRLRVRRRDDGVVTMEAEARA